MKKTVYIHIGTFKTGTSAIQKYLNENREYLASHDFFVPEGELAMQHALPITLIIDNSTFRSAWPQYKYNSSFYWELLTQQMEKTRCKNIIISSEAFCDFTHPAITDHEFFSTFLKTFFSKYEVKIICYLRNIFAYLKSFYGEMIKNGQTCKSFNEIVNEFIRQKCFHAFPKKVLDFYADTFGKDALIIREYDKNKIKNSDIISDFLDLLSLNADSKRRVNANLSLSDEDIALKRLFNYFDFTDLQFNRRISSALIAQKNTSDSSKIDYSEIINSAQSIKKVYNIDILNDKEKCDYRDICITEAERFIITLLSLSIKQNREILFKLNKLLSTNK